MLFAFAAAGQLFDASLRWESDATNRRRAAMVAERKMGDLRAWAEDYFSTHSFDDGGGWSSQVGGPFSYPDAPGFEIMVAASPAQYLTPNPIKPNPPPGFYSPSSHFHWVAPALPANQQRHPLWLTYPYSRDVSESMRRVEITVNYGNNNSRQYQLVTVISDPISRPRPTPSVQYPQEPVRILGPGNISVGNPAEYQAELILPNGQPITDVTFLWWIEPVSTGAVTLLPMDPQANQVRITRDGLLTPAGSNATVILGAKCVYRGQEIVGYTGNISLP